MSRRSPKSGGIFLPIGIVGGLALGAVGGQPIVGMLAGTVAGVAAAAWLWIKDSKRGG